MTDVKLCDPRAILVTEENFEDVQQTLPPDQGAELVVGCQTWKVFHLRYYGDVGHITVWPNGRAARCMDDSVWGDWCGDKIITEFEDEQGRLICFNADGELIDEDGQLIGDDD